MDFFHNINNTTTNCNNFGNDSESTNNHGIGNSTTFNMEKEYQDINRIEIYYQWKVERCERKKSEKMETKKRETIDIRF